eukprot:363250-Chlamydomonas_euryale.AAC.7
MPPPAREKQRANTPPPSTQRLMAAVSGMWAGWAMFGLQSLACWTASTIPRGTSWPSIGDGSHSRPPPSPPASLSHDSPPHIWAPCRFLCCPMTAAP